MSMPDNPPAFPVAPNPTMITQEGMSLRDWFAGMALQGMCANPDIAKAMSEQGMKPYEIRDSFASSAFAQADEMLIKREESP